MTADRTIETIMRTAPVIPVIVINDVADAVPMAQALVAGGLKVLEVTLRTPAALEAIALMKQVEGAIVGAGTVIDPRTLDAALKAGSEFIVSPGLTENLGKAAIASGIPFLPGTANAGDIMLGLDMGLTHFKFFPAMAAGGIPALKALSAPFGQCKFCPTGGVTLETAGNWLALDPVLCVGGSWMIPAGPLDPSAIQRNASAAHSLG
ncbi:MAG: bifunctional 4-hydroxy-2-oxoglutarate aldolase/2-dehydro-3-deoxy-phosphogluconate aldolase [Blastomonas sp.]